MSEENKSILEESPILTFDNVQAEKAVGELVLNLGDEAPAPAPPSFVPEELEDRARLTPAEMKQVEEFADKINIRDSGMILQYGSGAQKKMTAFSETTLSNVKTKDLGEIGEQLTGLIKELRTVDSDGEDKGGFLGLFKKSGNKISNMKLRYTDVETNVNSIAKSLENHQITLLKDVATMDKLYEQNVLYFKELSMYILAGRKKLALVEKEELPALREKAQKSGLPEDAQAVNDVVNLCDRFSKKLYDLDLTRTISVQMAPQIRLIQNSNTVMSEKIQSTIVNTIPLWKSQIVLALGIEHAESAAKAQREVTDMTNELLRKNSERLKMATIESAKESERGIVDIETLQETNKNLIESLDEVVRIQGEGRQRRQEAEVELARIEGELKQKLLEMK